MPEPQKMRRSLAESLRRSMLALSLAPLFAFFVFVAAAAWVARHHVAELITVSLKRLEAMIEQMVAGDGGLQIKARAQDVARQVEAYLREHPGVTLAELRRSELFAQIAVQRVGVTGYTALYEAGTGLMRFHPDPALFERPLSELAATLPDWWSIYNAPPEGKEDAGFYEWIEPDGFRTRKYMAVCPVRVPLEGRTLMVAATTYLEEFMWAARIASDLGRSIEREYALYTEEKTLQVLFALGLVVGVTLLVLYGLNRRALQTFVSPIRDLAEAVARFGGTPSPPAVAAAVLGRPDEIGELARTYEAMRRQIADQIEHLERARRELAQSEERFRKAFEEASIGMTLVSPEGTVLDVNPALCSILGYRREELIGKPGSLFHHPDEIEKRTTFFARLLDGRVASAQQVRRLIRRDGEIVWAQISSSLRRDEKGNPLHFISLVQDITEKKKAEDELLLTRFCIEKAAMSIYRLDEKGRILDANEHACRMLGYEREELLRMTVFEIDPRVTHERWMRLIGQLKSGVSRVIQSLNRRKDGTIFPVEIATSHFQVEGEDILYAFVSDVSDRLEAEAARRKLEAQLQQAQKMEAIGTLAGGVAHDFNNILAVIVGNANLLELSEGLAAADRNSVAQILAASARARELIKQILAFSRRGVQEKILVNLKPVVKETAQFLKSTLPSSIEVRQHIAADSPPLLADPTQMQQVLMNLCTNAAHAMEDSEAGTIEIRLEPARLTAQELRFQPDVEPGLFVHLTVADSGCGIPHEHRDRIFDPYFTTKPAGKGTGLGLAVVHGIVQHHGGFIRVESTPGKGTAFHIFLPAADSLAAQDTLPAPAASPLPRGSGIVLFVDDEPALVDMGAHMLAHLGYTPEPRTSPLEALAAFRANPEKFAAVVTDMTMPHMNGMSLARKILETRPDTPIVLCTGFSDKANEETAAAAGIRAFLHKPLTLADLAGALKGMLETKRPPVTTP